MKPSDFRKTWLAGIAAVALVAGACSDMDNTAREPINEADPIAGDTREAPMAGDRRDAEAKPINLTGCLQRGDGEFILTTADMAAGEPAATSGAAVQKQQMQAAAKAYRLSGEDDTLEPHIGSRIRVTGTLEEASELQAEHRAEAREPGATGTTGARTGERREPLDIDVDELAEVHVTSVEKVAGACGQQGNANRR